MCDGWCEQGGRLSNDRATFLIKYKDTNYNAFCHWVGGKGQAFYSSDMFFRDITVSGFSTNGPTNGNVKQRDWFTHGYIDLDIFTSLNSGT